MNHFLLFIVLAVATMQSFGNMKPSTNTSEFFGLRSQEEYLTEGSLNLELKKLFKKGEHIGDVIQRLIKYSDNSGIKADLSYLDSILQLTFHERRKDEYVSTEITFVFKMNRLADVSVGSSFIVGDFEDGNEFEIPKYPKQ
jgi:hypothetical protein